MSCVSSQPGCLSVMIKLPPAIRTQEAQMELMHRISRVRLHITFWKSVSSDHVILLDAVTMLRCNRQADRQISSMLLTRSASS